MIWNFILNSAFFLSLVANAALFIPQAMKLYRAKNSKGLSAITFFGFLVIQAMTVMHAYLRGDVILLIGVSLAMFTCGTVLYLIVLYRNAA